MTLLSRSFDASFANYAADRKYTSVYLQPYNNFPIAWHSRNQNFLALSTASDEYITLAASTQAILPSKRMLVQTGITPDAMVSLHKYNQAATDMMPKQFGTKMRKLIDLRCRFLQDSTAQERLSMQHVPAAKEKADKFTKTLRRVILNTQFQLIGVDDDQTKHDAAQGEYEGLLATAGGQP